MLHQCIRKLLTIEKAKILGNTFIVSQFNYAPLILVFCRKTKLKIEKLYSKLKKIHHKTLKVIYGIDNSYNNLLLDSVTPCQFIKGTFDS